MVRLLSSHIVAHYTEALWDLTGVTAGSWSEQYCDVQVGRREKNNHYLRNFIDFFNIYSPFKVLVNELINSVTSVIASDDVNVELAADFGTKIVSGFDEIKNLVRYPLKERIKQKRL